MCSLKYSLFLCVCSRGVVICHLLVTYGTASGDKDGKTTYKQSRHSYEGGGDVTQNIILQFYYIYIYIYIYLLILFHF